MSYNKLNLKNGDTLTAEHIAHIESGIEATDSEVAELATLGGEIAENINNHESRISTLENGGGGGGDKRYWHRVHIFCGEYSCPYASLFIEFLSGDATPITSLAPIAQLCNRYTPEVPILSKTGELYLVDAPEGKREVESFDVFSSPTVSVNYITAYTAPIATENVHFAESACTVTDTVTEV